MELFFLTPRTNEQCFYKIRYKVFQIGQITLETAIYKWGEGLELQAQVWVFLCFPFLTGTQEAAWTNIETDFIKTYFCLFSLEVLFVYCQCFWNSPLNASRSLQPHALSDSTKRYHLDFIGFSTCFIFSWMWITTRCLEPCREGPSLSKTVTVYRWLRLCGFSICFNYQCRYS